jgi:hypothetical protein
MNRGLGRLVLLIGTLSYAAVGCLALMSWIANVEIFSLATLGLLVQIALAVPLVAFLFGGRSMPVLPYAQWLVAVVSVLAISGMLGVPSDSHRSDDARRAIEIDIAGVKEDMGARKILVLKRDLAEAEKEKREGIQKEIEEITKDISDKEKEELERKVNGLEAKGSIARFDEPSRTASLLAAERRNVLLVLAAFVALAGAWLMDREKTAPVA